MSNSASNSISSTVTTESKTVGEATQPLKLSLRSERVKSLGVRSGLAAGITCGSCSCETPRW